MSKWATLLKYGKQVADSSLKYGKQAANSSAAKTMGDAMIHPQRTLTGLGKATKTAVVGGGMGYLAWENIVNDKPIVRTAADVLVGEETVDKGLEVVGKASDKMENMVETVGKNVESISSSVSAWLYMREKSSYIPINSYKLAILYLLINLHGIEYHCVL